MTPMIAGILYCAIHILLLTGTSKSLKIPESPLIYLDYPEFLDFNNWRHFMAVKLMLEELQEEVTELLVDVINKKYTGALIGGRGGLGKSRCVEEAFVRKDISTEGCFNAYTTPLALY